MQNVKCERCKQELTFHIWLRGECKSKVFLGHEDSRDTSHSLSQYSIRELYKEYEM